MVELVSVLLILLLFVFPLPIFAAGLGLFSTWGLYRKYETVKNQPVEGRKNLILSLVLFLMNFICSIFLGVALALAVHYFIFDNFYLFIFNFLFCTAISLRWFDFTHKLYRRYIFKLKPKATASHFAVCQGFHRGEGLWLTQVYIDAGTLEVKENRMVFKGVFREETFTPANIIGIEKKSSEKIKILSKQHDPAKPEVFLITLKEKFYPFKSRPDRDKIFEQLQPQPA